MDTHLPFDGVTAGDIGAKMGMNAMDNGFLLFNQYRIPRENLLSRFTYVDREGNFEVHGDLRALYSAMVSTRVGILGVACSILSRSSLIATRYAVSRRQFKTIKGIKDERKLLDYQTHMSIIGPHVAALYVFMLVKQTVMKIIE